MDVQQTSSPSPVPNPIRTFGLHSNGTSFVQLESVDYNQLRLEQAQLQSQNQHPIQAYAHSGELVSMSGFIENGQFVPIQLNTMSRSISNNSITHPDLQYRQTNQNQMQISFTITYQCASPLYQQSTFFQAPPPLLESNMPAQTLGGTKTAHHDVRGLIDNDIFLQKAGWQTVHGTKKSNRTGYNSNNIIAANQHTTAPVNFRPQTYRNRIPYAQPQNIMSNDSNQVTNQAQ
jgi:hypothetical protein